MYKLSNDMRYRVDEVNEILAGEGLPLINHDNVVGMVEDPDDSLGAYEYILVKMSEKLYEAYKIKHEDSVELMDAWRGTPYSVLKPIMARVAHDTVARYQVTELMSQAYSPLDNLFTKKGQTDEELARYVANLDPNELYELKDFAQGLSMLVKMASSNTPAGASEFYPTRVVDYDVHEAYLEDEYEDEYDEYLIYDDHEDYIPEIVSDYGEDEAEVEDSSPKNYISDNPSSHIPEHKEPTLPHRLLSLFKRNK